MDLHKVNEIYQEKGERTLTQISDDLYPMVKEVLNKLNSINQSKQDYRPRFKR